MLQLTILISNSLRNELAKNTKMNDFARCTHVQQRLILFKLYMLTKLHGKVLQRLPCSVVFFFFNDINGLFFISSGKPFYSFKR